MQKLRSITVEMLIPCDITQGKYCFQIVDL